MLLLTPFILALFYGALQTCAHLCHIQDVTILSMQERPKRQLKLSVELTFTHSFDMAEPITVLIQAQSRTIHAHRSHVQDACLLIETGLVSPINEWNYLHQSLFITAEGSSSKRYLCARTFDLPLLSLRPEFLALQPELFVEQPFMKQELKVISIGVKRAERFLKKDQTELYEPESEHDSDSTSCPGCFGWPQSKERKWWSSSLSLNRLSMQSVSFQDLEQRIDALHRHVFPEDHTYTGPTLEHLAFFGQLQLKFPETPRNRWRNEALKFHFKHSLLNLRGRW